MERSGRVSVGIARLLSFVAFLALLGAWIAQVKGGTLMGLTQEHLFNDAIALALLGIAMFVDAYWHARGSGDRPVK